jgi:TolB protein
MKCQSPELTHHYLTVVCVLLLFASAFSIWARPNEPTLIFSAREKGIWNIYTMNLAGQNIVQLTATPWVEGHPDWSSDGRRIVFRSDEQLAIMDCDGSNLQRFDTGGVSHLENPRWSPDGKKIAFSAPIGGVGAPGVDDVFVFDLETETVENLSRHPSRDLWPAWSDDSQRLVFSSNRDPQFWAAPNALTADLYITDVSGNALVNLTQSKPHETFPDWSPDGLEIVFFRTADGINGDIYVMEVDSRSEERVTKTPEHINFVTWSPDGRQILFIFIRNGTGKMGIINRDGSNRRELPDPFNGQAVRPRWFDPNLVVSPAGLEHTTWGEIKQERKSSSD